MIDGGTGTNTLFIYGTVDLTGVTLNNITVLVVNSDVTLTPAQIAQFTTVDGDGNSVINIEIPPGSTDTYILNLSALDMTDVGSIIIDGDITIKIDDINDLAGVQNISSGAGDELILEVNGVGAIDLADIADTFDQVDEIELDDNVTLTVNDAADVTDLGLSEISGSGDIETSGGAAVETALDTLIIAPTVNTAPVAHNDSVNITENQTITVDVVGNDTDADNDTLNLISVSTPAGKGSVSIVGGELRFNPGTDFDALGTGQQEQVAVSYTVSDGDATDQGTLIITVTGINEAATINGTVSLDTMENRDLVISEVELLAFASDEENDDLSVTNLTVIGAGSLTDNNNGTWTFTPAANTFGDVTLNYDINDGNDSVSTSADLTITEITFTIPYGDFAGTTLHFNDPLLPFQANLLGYVINQSTGEYEPVEHINLLPVWDEYTGSGVRVASVEAIDYTHPELSSTYLSDHFLSYDPVLIQLDYSYHGTATAGVISSGADNGMGLVGIAYGATITSFDGNDETGDRFDVITNSTGVGGTLFF